MHLPKRWQLWHTYMVTEKIRHQSGILSWESSCFPPLCPRPTRDIVAGSLREPESLGGKSPKGETGDPK